MQAEDEAEANRVAKGYKADLDFLKFDPDVAFEGEDVLIKLPNDGRLLRAKRVLLSSKSPVFKLMFENDTTRRDQNLSTYTIEDYSAAVMRAVIRFCHNAEIKFTEEVRPEAVLKVAYDYEIDHLQYVCADHLLSNWNIFSPADVGVMLAVACNLKIYRLELLCTNELIALLNDDTVTAMLRVGKTCGAKRLLEAAVQYLKDNFDTSFPAVLAYL